MLILATSWYVIKNKFNTETYINWMTNLLNNVIKFKLVIFTDSKSLYVLEPLIKDNQNIKIVIIEMEDFYTYKFKDYFITHHPYNEILGHIVDWKLIMLWCEKISFVKKLIYNNYFEVKNDNNIWYGWCDIGYFRNTVENQMNISHVKHWPDEDILMSLYKDKIYYVQTCEEDYFSNIKNIILRKDMIPKDQYTIAGGFFLITKTNIDWWFKTYYEKMIHYFYNTIIVKDDQLILVDCVVNNISKFILVKEHYINNKGSGQGWMGFSTFLLKNPINISILLPIYNGIEFIDSCITSIRNQTIVRWELIIGINGHPSNSEVYQKAKEYEKIDYRIKVYDLFNITGKDKALNDMLKYCKYDWVSLIDVDDIWNPSKLEKQIPYMDSYDVIGTLCQYFEKYDFVPYIPVGDISDYNFLISNPIINSSSLIKKELCHWDGTYYLEDYDLFLRLWKQNKKFFNVNSVEVLHRIHDNSAFNMSNKQDLQSLLKKYEI